MFGQLPVVDGVVADGMAPIQEVLHLLAPPPFGQIPPKQEEGGPGAVVV